MSFFSVLFRCVPCSFFVCISPVFCLDWCRNRTSSFVKNPLNVNTQTKATLIAIQSVPEGSKGCPKTPKENPKLAQCEQNDVEGHPKESHKAQNRIHINKIYAQTSDPPPYSGRRILHDIASYVETEGLQYNVAKYTTPQQGMN